jgi:flagellar hook-associated protein 3 FlgL
MRIATSTIYDNQIQSIDNLSAQYQSIGQDLSTGKSLNVPSDDPSQIAQDLTITTQIASENGDASNATAAQNELTFTDSTLSSLTSLLQTARSLAVSGATDIIPNGTQRPLIGQQVAGLLNQALALANTQYGGTYLFAGSGSSTTAPITPLGSPPNAVSFTGNNDTRTEIINGQSVAVGTTMQAAFNQSSTDGTPSVFTLLATLRDTMDNEPASIQSQQPINVTGQIIQGAADAAPTTLGQIVGPPAMTSVPLTADNAVPPSYSIEIDGTNPATGGPGSAQFTFQAATPVDGVVAGAPPLQGIVQQINAQTAVTGVTATWNVASQRLQLTSTAPNSPPFLISDIPTPVVAASGNVPVAVTTAATTKSTFLEAFQIPDQVSVTSNLSTQIGDIDAVINQVLSARANIGQQIQNLAGTTSQLQVLANDNTTTKSGYEDTNIAQATSQFTLTQTALQAAYATTSRLEGKTLIDYL